MMIQLTHDRYHKGTVLVIALVMLLLLTIIGLAAMRGTALQERMSGNLYLQHRALQSSEASLNEGERDLAASASPYPGLDERCGADRVFSKLDESAPAGRPTEWQCFEVFAPRRVPYRINGRKQKEYGQGPILRVELHQVNGIGRIMTGQDDTDPLSETVLVTAISVPDF